MRRFRVAEDSMRPTLAPGEEFVVSTVEQAAVGDVVAFPHPQRDDFWLVKRLAAVSGDTVPGYGRLGPGRAWVVSDNPHDGVVDSRSFGPVPLAGLHPMVSRLGVEAFHEGVSLLAGEDPALGALVSEHGVPELWSRVPGFPSLVWLILEQQVSLESGAAVYRRLVEVIGEPTPEAVAGLGEDGLREVGTTRQKAGYLLGLAGSILGGELDLDHLAGLVVGEARERLLAIRGVGPWTADTYLLAALGHLDVFPVGDRALQVGTAEVLGLASIPGPEELELASQPWRPIRAVAARLIWHAYLRRRGREESAPPPAGPTTSNIGVE